MVRWGFSVRFTLELVPTERLFCAVNTRAARWLRSWYEGGGKRKSLLASGKYWRHKEPHPTPGVDDASAADARATRGLWGWRQYATPVNRSRVCRGFDCRLGLCVVVIILCDAAQGILVERELYIEYSRRTRMYQYSAMRELPTVSPFHAYQNKRPLPAPVEHAWVSCPLRRALCSQYNNNFTVIWHASSASR